MIRTRRTQGLTAFGLVLLVLMLFPIYWVGVSSLETSDQIFHAPPYILPPTPTFAPYSAALAVMGRYMLNSGIVAVGTVLLSVALGAPAAYAMTHLRLRVAALLVVLLLLVTQMFPDIMLATPLFIIFNHLHLINSYAGLILANATGGVPFVILVLRAYLLTVPAALTEAAWVDGASLFGAFWRVIIPVAFPGVVTASVFVLLGAWGDFTYGVTLTTDNSIQPVSVGLYNFIGQYGTVWNNLMAAAVLTALPTFVVLAVAQRYVSAGLTLGAVKG